MSLGRLLPKRSERSRPEFTLLAALIVAAGGVLGFLHIADAIEEGDTRAFDRAVMVGLRESQNLADAWGPVWFTNAMIDLTALGSTAVLTLLTIFTAGFLLVSGKKVGAFLVPVSVGGAAITMSLLKDLFARTRPDVVPHLVDFTSESFPSGHAMVATAAYLTLGVIMAEATKRRVGTYVMVSAVALSLIIGFSRVYLGVHWPTDVLAGWCGGAAWAMGCWLLTHRVVAREPATDPIREEDTSTH